MTMILCIGNRDGGDDALGPYIADQLQKQNLSDLDLVDCGTTPENYTAVVKRKNPSEVFIIDAVDMGLPHGEIRRVPKERISQMHISTHGIPLSVLITYLEQYVKTILLIGVQPKTMAGSLTKTMQQSGDQLIEIIINKTIHQLPLLEK
jgi:hydrogenase 3 maturation protease